MKNRLCCTVNPYAKCICCGEKWCSFCWYKSNREGWSQCPIGHYPLGEQGKHYTAPYRGYENAGCEEHGRFYE